MILLLCQVNSSHGQETPPIMYDSLFCLSKCYLRAMPTHLFIKNMVCDRCVLVVQQQLDRMGLPPVSIRMGEVELAAQPSPEQLDTLRGNLQSLGFELLDNRKSTIVERTKNAIIQLIHHHQGEPDNRKLSVFLEEKLGIDYHQLTTLFSSVEGVTIEKYAILQRVEKAKELLMYDEQSLSQIADQLGYSSVQHLSQQFKKITGLTPSHFKQLKDNKRKPLDQV